ncbi:MAG: AAA family ATPase [Deltaproteobacteria bacterium]|nr:AAA family ATPase [Deltaproteobacteria bacterium]
MNCPKCQHENPKAAKFCVECGGKLERTCRQCGSINPSSNKFCGECGRDLTEPSPSISKGRSFDDKIARIQKSLPSGITEKILSQRDRIEGEKRQVTVMFCDMKGFTSLSEKLGPEITYAMMDEVYEILIHKVHNYEGTVNEMTGDGVMALFGAPIALEDAPQRAIRSAMAIHREMTRFNDRMRMEKGEFPPVKMRIGIHTGPVVVGTLGNDLRVEFKAVGDTVNVASRMESLAEPGTTYISEDTFKITEGLFRVEALGEKEIKGKEKPLKVYQVIAPSSRRTRFDVSAERGLTPFVGRQKELELLLDGFERSREGRGQAISIISEAGIGKSRLLYEFRKAVTNENVTFLEGKCLSYSRNSAYHPIVDILKANFEIQDDDTDQQVKEKVISFLKIIQVDVPSTLPYIQELLSVKEGGIEKIQMSPEARKDRTLETLKRITLKGSELRPLIMAVEDLHWMDRSSEDALKELLEGISGSRIFLIFTYRPEFVHTWGSRSYHSQVTLNRLSNRESLAMIENILGSREIDHNLEDLILQKAEGVPFFIEEFIKSLRELNVIEKSNGTYKLTRDFKSISIPSTIQDVIMARVDHLPEGAREVLRTGSVIEREFSHELIRKVTGLPENQLLSNLSTLRDSELLYERGIYPNSTYIFKHALTREVAYDSVLTKKRKQIHDKIARTIEEIYGENICDCYGVLANHCIASEDYEKGAKYAKLEARRYQKAGSFSDAIEYAKKSIACLEKLPQTEANQKKVVDARTTLSNYYLDVNFYLHARRTVEPVLDLALALNYRKKLPAIYTAIGLNYLYVEEDRKGLEFIDQTVSIAGEVADYFLWWTALYQSGPFLEMMSELEEAHKRFQQCLDFSLSIDHKLGIAFAKGGIATSYHYEGKMNPARQFAQEALTLAKETGDAFVKAMAYSAYGGSCYGKGLFDEAKIYLTEWVYSYEKLTPLVWIAWNHEHLGSLHLDLREYNDAVNCYNKIIPIFESRSFMPSIIRLFQTSLLRVRVLRHDRDIELGGLFECYENNKFTWSKARTARNIGDILTNIDNNHLLDAEAWFRKAIDADRKSGYRWELAQDHTCYADWFKKKGDIQGAKEQITKAIDIFRECGADGWVTRTERALAEIA